MRRGLFSRVPLARVHQPSQPAPRLRPLRPPPVVSAQFYPAGVAVTSAEYSPGDFLLTRGKSWVSTLIRWGQAFRFGINSPYAYWSHSALLVDSNGTLVEAMADGIKYGTVDRYRAQPYTIVRVGITLSPEDRVQAVAFAQSCVGWKYGYFTFASIALSCLTGGRWGFGRQAEEVCSGLVARALERGSIRWERDPHQITPGDLAKAFSVNPPP